MFKIRRRDLVRGFGVLSVGTLISPSVFAKNHGPSAPPAPVPSRPPAPQPPPPPTRMTGNSGAITRAEAQDISKLGYLIRSPDGRLYLIPGGGEKAYWLPEKQARLVKSRVVFSKAVYTIKGPIVRELGLAASEEKAIFVIDASSLGR